MSLNLPVAPVLPQEKKLFLKIVSMLRNSKAADAITFIEAGRDSGLEGFKHPFIDYLHSRACALLPSTSQTQPLIFSGTVELKERLCHDLPADFKNIVQQKSDHQYQKSEAMAGDKIVTALLGALTVAEQEKILPYKGKIYLPTNRYTDAEQVDGIKKTAAYLSEINTKATTARLQTLRALIKESGVSKCLIVANGPSLKRTNLAMLDNAFIIGLNSIFLHPYITPHVIVCEDHLVGEDRARELNEHDKSIKIIPGYLTYCVDPDDLTIVLNHRPRVSFPVDIDFSDRIEKVTYTGGTVTYTALQVAVGLGFKHIELVGCDASYKVENVKEENDYATGVFESLGDDPNHFNPSYFGQGYRWHDPNPLRMMQAYSVAERYAASNGISITNLTRGGMLEVFRREDFLARVHPSYPRVCVIDWIDINSNAATGEVKKALFKDWPKHKLLHVYSPRPSEIRAYKSSSGDIFYADPQSILPTWKAVIENNPGHLYWRPTHNRPILNLFAALLFCVERKPFSLHLMDYWTVKIDDDQLRLAYEEALDFSIKTSAHFFVISQRMKNRFCNRLGLQSTFVSVAHNYVPALASLPLRTAPRADNAERLVFYSGNLDPDQSLDPLSDICEAIKILNSVGSVEYKFVVRTSDYHIRANGHRFNAYDFVILQAQSDDFDEYVGQISSADLCILCYGFSAQSRAYLLDSMANKLPDLIMAKSKFFAYGDPEIGTLNYLQATGYPFVQTKRDPRVIASQIESISSMNYASYAEICAQSFSIINNEFSEMAQCHIFQKHLAIASINNASGIAVANSYLDHALLYKNIATLSSANISEGLNNEFALMEFLANHGDLIDPVYDRVREHGITWSINADRIQLAKSLDAIEGNKDLIIQALAWMIASQRHERFAELWAQLFSLIVKT